MDVCTCMRSQCDLFGRFALKIFEIFVMWLHISGFNAVFETYSLANVIVLGIFIGFIE